MSRRRGPLEEQTVKVAALMKSSEHATKVGVFAVTLIAHPTEGVIISGEESLAKLMTEILKNPALAREVKEAPARGGMMVPNYFSSRREKGLALKKLYNCSLPPLPMPFSELTTYAMVLGAFGEVWKSELQGTKFKVGDPMPDSFKAWFTEDEEVFRCLKGSVTHWPALGDRLQERGKTIAQFYREQVQSAYALRLRGKEKLLRVCYPMFDIYK